MKTITGYESTEGRYRAGSYPTTNEHERQLAAARREGYLKALDDVWKFTYYYPFAKPVKHILDEINRLREQEVKNGKD